MSFAESLCVLLLVALCVWLPGEAQAGWGYGIEVQRTSAEAVVVQPGQVVSATFRVTNPDSTPLDAIETIDLPEGWKLLTGTSGPVTIGGGESRARVIAFDLPDHAAAGRYVIGYSIRGRTNPGVGGEATLSVVVAETSALSLEVLQAPEWIVEGEPFEAQLSLHNSGNQAVTVDLTAASGDLTVAVSPPQITLTAGASASVLLSGEAEETGRPAQHAVRISAKGVKGDDLSDSAVFFVDTLPEGLQQIQLRRRFPSQVTVGAVAGDDQIGLQASASGAGTVTGRSTLRYEVTGPDTADIGMFGQRDVARLTLDSPHLNLLLGDQNYGLTELVSPARYGRGAGLTLTPGIARVGAHYVQSRFDSPELAEYGGHVGVEADRLRAGAHLLQRTEASVTDTFASATGSATLLKHHTLAAEGSITDPGAPVVPDRAAWLASAEGRFGESALYALRHIHAGADYTGYYTDTELTTATASLTAGRISVSGSAQSVADNLRLDPDRGSARHERLVRPRLQYSTDVWRFGLGADAARSEDRMPDPTWRYQEGAGRLTMSRATSVTAVTLEAIPGLRQDQQADTTDWHGRYAAYLSYHPQPLARLDFSAVYSSGAEAETSLFGEENRLGVTATFAVAQATQVAVLLNRSIGATYQDQLRIDLTHTRPGGLIARLQAGTTATPDRELVDSSAMLSLTMPFDLPTSRNREVGAVRGQLRRSDGSGVAGAVVSIHGRAAVTDEDGRFTLSGVPVGVQALHIDQASLGRDSIAAALPPLDIRPAAITDVTIEVKPGARLTGQITLLTTNVDGGPSIGEVGTRQLPGMIIELSQGDESTIRRTDHSGTFRFAGLSPGRWVMQVRDRGLPDRAVVDEPMRIIEITAGEDRTEDVTVRLVNRQIQIIDAGSLSLQVTTVPEPEVTYVVGPGDTLSQIAARELGSSGRWMEIYRLNRALLGSRPDYIRVGQVLKLPADTPDPQARRASGVRLGGRRGSGRWSGHS